MTSLAGPLLIGVATFVALVPWGERLVGALLARGIGKQVRDDEPDAHQAKTGTATMGGVYFLSGILVVTIILAVNGRWEGIGPLIAMVGYGLLGAFDDWRGLHDRGGVGWAARYKFPAQWSTALLLALIVMALTPRRGLSVPITGQWIELGWWMAPILTFLIVYTANAVNLTDGLDGLAGGTAALGFAAFGVLAISTQRGPSGWGLAAFCFAVVGALGAFLWVNAHPARLFMGDLGSQALGAGLAVVAVQSGHWLLLPVIGVVFLMETLSVMIQVGHFKATRRKFGEGRRVFRMAPIHYHFELGGWSEVQIVVRAWMVTAAAAIVGLVLGGGV
jgi:phospho-N-acetylmuramoyl-pentapeptide-transferase